MHPPAESQQDLNRGTRSSREPVATLTVYPITAYNTTDRIGLPQRNERKVQKNSGFYWLQRACLILRHS